MKNIPKVHKVLTRLAWVLLVLLLLLPQSVLAADYQDTSFLNFSMDNNLVRGHIVSIDGKSDFKVENGCIVLEGGFTHRTIPIRIQLSSNVTYDYCVAGLGESLNQYNDAGVLVNGTLSSNEYWETSYPQTEIFDHDAEIDISLIYGPYSNVNYPVYGKRTVKIYIQRVGADGEPESSQGEFYNLPLLFVAPSASDVQATASISEITYNVPTPVLNASWKLGANTGTTASYQWYKMVDGSYQSISDATGSSYTPDSVGTYKVDITLQVTSTLSGVPIGSYTASAEATVAKKSPGVQLGWNGSRNPDASVTLGDAVSLTLSAVEPGTLRLRKGDQLIWEQVVSSSDTRKDINHDLGAASLAMAGEYSWVYIPEFPDFIQEPSGTLNLTVNKFDPQVSVSLSRYISCADYRGELKWKAAVSGVFTFTTNGKTQEVTYTDAGNEGILSDLSALIPAGTAMGSYTMDYRFVPDAAADYREKTGTLNYTVDDACDLVIQQVPGGTVRINGSTASIRAASGESFTVTVTPDPNTSSSYSRAESITVNGTFLPESNVESLPGGTLSASITIPADCTNKTYTVSAVFDHRKLVLKNNQRAHVETGISAQQDVMEDAVFEAVFDAQNSIGISREDVTITYYQGISENVLGETSESWAALNDMAINIYGSDLHAFGRKDPEKIRFAVKGTDLIAEVNFTVIRLIPTTISSKDSVVLTKKANAAEMQQDLELQLDAKAVNEFGSAILAPLQYSDENGHALDWNHIPACSTVTVLISYAGEKTENGGFGASSKTVSVSIRPEIMISAADRDYTAEAIEYEVSDFTVSSVLEGYEVRATGIEGLYDADQNACSEILNAGTYYVKLHLEDAYGAFVSDFVPVKVSPAVLTVSSLSGYDRHYDGTDRLSLSNITLNGIRNTDDVTYGISSAFARLESKNVGEYSTVTLERLVLTGSDAANYIIDEAVYSRSFELPVPVRILEAPLTIQGTLVDSSKVFDGTTDAVITDPGTSHDIFPGDSVMIRAGYAQYSDASVGTGKTVTFHDFSLEGPDAGNYFVYAQPESVTASITPRTLSVDVTVRDKQFDGTTKAEIESASLVGAVPGTDVTLIPGIPQFAHAGDADEEKTVAVTFTDFSLSGADAANYTLTQPASGSAIIYNRYIAVQGIDYTVNSNDWINKPFTVAPADGCVLLLTPDGSYASKLLASLVDAQGQGSLSFYVKNAAGAISTRVTESYKIDTVAPTGSLSVAENQWNSFLNTVTLGLFFNETYDILIQADDNLSGIASIACLEYKGTQGYTLEELKALDESCWREGASYSVSWDELNQYIYYVRILDRAGNVTYLSSGEGIEYDVTPPAVSGATDGAVLYTSANVTVSDRNLAAVTLDGETVSAAFTLPGNCDHVYVIRAEDLAGNVTTVTVTMKPIASLLDPLSGITPENVSEDDSATLKGVKEQLDAIDPTDASDAEKQQLQEVLESVEALEDIVRDTSDEVESLTDAAEAFDSDTVTSEHEEALEDLVSALESLQEEKGSNLSDDQKSALEEAASSVRDLLDKIGENREALQDAASAQEGITSGNYTVDDKSALEATRDQLDAIASDENRNYTEAEKEIARTEKERLDAILEEIREIESVRDAIGDAEDRLQLLDPADSCDDEALLGSVLSALDTYAQLNTRQKELLGEDTGKALDELLTAVTAYRIVEGHNGEYTKGSASGLAFTANGPFSLFFELRVDGSVLDPKSYTASSGSTVVSLKPTFLMTLSEGEHSLEVVYDLRGTKYSAACSFHVNPASDIPDTGDASGLVLWLSLLALCTAALPLLKKKALKA